MRMQGTEAEPYIRIVSAKPKIAPKAAAAQVLNYMYRKYALKTFIWIRDLMLHFLIEG